MGWGAWALLVKGLGINSYGSELSNIQVENAKLNGIITLNWEEIPLFGFDFINAEQVFEHLNNPIETLIHLSSGLLKGGIIKISVPYASDLDRRLELMDWSAVKWSDNSLNIVSPLEHINCFRKETLYKMAELANLQVVFQRENENYILLKK
jgi:predicted SAM-dependent methyltransferase